MATRLTTGLVTSETSTPCAVAERHGCVPARCNTRRAPHDHFDHRRPQKIAIGIDCRGSNSHTVHVEQRRGAPREVPTDVQHIRIGPQVFPPTWGPKPRDAFHRHSGRKQSCRTRSQLAVESTPQGKVEAPHVVLPTAIEHRGFRCGAALRRSRQQSAEE